MDGMGSIFNMFPLKEPFEFLIDSDEEAFRKDAEAIRGDFDKAFGQIEKELAQKPERR